MVILQNSMLLTKGTTEQCQIVGMIMVFEMHYREYAKTYQQHVTLSCFISNDAETSYLIDDLETKSLADQTEGDKF